MRRFFICFLFLAGCAAPLRVREEKPVPPLAAISHPWREMIVYIPQTDEGSAGWPKWFAKYPGLRMVIAMSPRFLRVAKDPVLKAQLLALKKEDRLELALQVPNAPILPLIVEDPPYGYPDDVVQLIAQAKAGFFKTWSFLPQGLALPYGAASPKLISLLERLGFSWTIAAVGLPAVDGAYQSGPLAIWEGAPSGKPESTAVRVWDERDMKGRLPLDTWVMEAKAKSGLYFLPHDSGLSTFPWTAKEAVKLRTWSAPDGSAWIGSPEKDSAWSALRRTREALEKYKNSGLASVQRLDVAFEEIYTAQNSNYFSAMGSATLSPALVEERAHEFQATLLAVYRVIGQAPPDDFFSSGQAVLPSGQRASSTTVRADSLPEGQEHVTIEDAAGDAIVPGGADLKSLDIWSSTDAVHWMVTLASTVTAASIDIYVDLNGQPNAGSTSFLPGRPFGTSPTDAWEYAIAIAGPTATLYRTQGAGTYGVVQSFSVVGDGNRVHVRIPRDLMRGNPRRWGYQVLVLNTTLSDFIDPLEISQQDLWQDLTTGKRNDIPFVRVRK